MTGFGVGFATLLGVIFLTVGLTVLLVDLLSDLFVLVDTFLFVAVRIIVPGVVTPPLG